MSSRGCSCEMLYQRAGGAMNSKEAEREDESPETMRKRKRHGQSQSGGGERRGRAAPSPAKAPEPMGILGLSSSHLCELGSAIDLILPEVTGGSHWV